MTKIEALELELAARKMVDGTGLYWGAVIRHQPTKQNLAITLDAYYPEDVELALGIVEGKPVWKRDIYYDGNSGYKTVAGDVHSKNYWAKCSWNPPAPKTVMVELTVEDVKAYVIHLTPILGLDCADSRLVSACRKALEGVK